MRTRSGLLVLSLCALSCAPKPATEVAAATDGTGRLWSASGLPLLDPAVLYDDRVVGRWNPQEALLASGDRGQANRQGPVAASVRLGEPLRTDDVAVVEIDLIAPGHGRVELAWTGANGRRGSLEAAVGPGPGERRTIRYFPSVREGWSGEIHELAMTYRGLPGDAVSWIELRSLERRVDLRRFADAQGHPWKVELGHEVRSALPFLPGQTLTAAVPPGGSSKLTTSVGVPATVPGDVVVTIRADGKVVERRGVDRGASSALWHDLAVDLPEGAREIALTVECPGASPERNVVFLGPTRMAIAGRRRPNVLLVSIDTLRAERLSLYGYPRDTSPRLGEWAATRAVVFENVVAPAPWTLPSHVSLFTGMLPDHHGVRHDVGSLADDRVAAPLDSLTALPAVLAAEGYATAAITGGAYLHPRYGFAQGFDRYRYWPNRGDDERELESGVDGALAWIGARSEGPWFFFLHTYAVHDPYRARTGHFEALTGRPAPDPPIRGFLESPPVDPSDGFRQHNHLVLKRGGDIEGRRAGEGDLDLVNDLYDSGVRYADEQIGRLLEELERRGIADETLVLITSDHGESLGEEGNFGHIEVDDTTLSVPLLVSPPGPARGGTRVPRQVRLVDVAPTVLEIVGAGRAAHASDGVSLVAALRGAPVEGTELAWSTSPAANRGVRLRREGAWEVFLDVNAWAPQPRQKRFTWLGSVPGSPAEAARIVAAAQDEIARTSRGLVLEVHNGGSGPLVAEVRGAPIHPQGPQSTDLEGPFLTWIEPGRAGLRVPPGERFRLLFQKVLGTELAVDGTVEIEGDPQTIRWRVDLADLERPEILGWNGREISPGEPEGPSTFALFRIAWQGGTAIGTVSPSASDPELRESLEALGYLR